MPRSSNLNSYQFGSEAKIYERLVFQYRPALLAIFIIATVFFSFQATRIHLDTNFLKMIPQDHPFIRNMMANLDVIGAAGTTIQIAVETSDKDIFSKEYMETVKQISDEMFYLKGIDRRGLESIWTPNVRWTEVTEEGFEGGPLIPNAYDGSQAKLEELRQNILRSGRVGSLVADNFKSSIVSASLFDIDPETGESLDYHRLSLDIEEKIRDRYQSDKIKIHIIGVAKLIGDLTDAGPLIFSFFVITFAVTVLLLFWYSRCIIGTFAPLLCSVVAVIWQLGILVSFEQPLSAYSSLVPFLIFAIGVSHGVQVINAVGINISGGDDSDMAARRAFRHLYVPGMTALVSDGVGFATLYVIDIPAIKDLTMAACIGIGVVILTNLVLLPIVLSYLGITQSGIQQVKRKQEVKPVIWEMLARLTRPIPALVSLVVMVLGFTLAFYGSKDLKIGDLDEGAPELRPDSRYNQDNKFISDNYTVSSDIFLIITRMPKEQCSTFENVEVMDRFGWVMENIQGVESSVSLSTVVRQVLAGFNEGNLKWNTIPRDQRAIDSTFFQIPNQLVSADCSYAPLILFLSDHKAETLQRVVAAAEKFIEENKMKKLEFLLASGNAGIEAATNEVLDESQSTMLWLVYFIVVAMVFISFNSISATAVIIIPLALTSALCEALMAYLGIGIKVATLPVIALGVGIGVDYGIYLYGRMESYLKEGIPLEQAYLLTLQTTGRAVMLTGIALAIGVSTWIWSPIKFQADMGKLLTFMFLWNMLGAIWLLPALSCFLLKPEKIIAQEMQRRVKKQKITQQKEC